MSDLDQAVLLCLPVLMFLPVLTTASSVLLELSVPFACLRARCQGLSESATAMSAKKKMSVLPHQQKQALKH